MLTKTTLSVVTWRRSLAKDLGLSGKQLRDQARGVVESELEATGESDQFRDLLR